MECFSVIPNSFTHSPTMQPLVLFYSFKGQMLCLVSDFSLSFKVKACWDI